MVSKKKTSLYGPEDINFVIKICSIGTFMFFSLGISTDFFLYGDNTTTDNKKWIFGFTFLTICLSVLTFLFFSKKTSLIQKWGGSTTICLFSVSYLVTNSVINPYIFNSMPWHFQLLGLFIGIGANLWWTAYTAKSIHNIFYNPALAAILYKEEDNQFIYKNGIQQIIIENKLKRHYLPNPIVWVILIPLQPLSFFIHKIIINNLGINYFTVFISALALPLSLMFNGLIVTTVLVYFYYPLKLRKLTGKYVGIEF
ncbi:hypothetical protein R6242_02475 [Iodobacter sp. CM08]|uniref:hypothetical protein n=1 Tax=Iodobacter sp. CM08 TaxID=3085902 RepID=UPI002981CAFE|nr:hypothetical protein [Iodobacter sp. CM08]MDW5415433.1 hypothetical protein [Iodobacter sp. CM08]